MSRVDHAEASSKFIEAKDHIEFHDKRLWDLRKKRDRESEQMPEWEELRSLASAIKEHTLTHLADYLEEFERNATANGIVVHWARDAAEHNQIVFDILESHDATTLVKSKSMLTDECDMRPFLENRGIEIIETDLGERIQQLDDEPPSHIVVPAVHKLRADVAEVFARTIGTDPKNHDVPYLAESQRQHTRPYYLKAGGRHDRRELRDRRDRQLRRLHQRRQRRPERQPAAAAHRVDRHREADPEDRAPRRVRPHAVAQRARLADHAAHLAFPRPAPRRRDARRAGRQRPLRAARHGRILDLAEMHPLRRLHEHLPGLPAQRRPELRGATYSGPIGVIIDPTFNLRKYSSLPFASTLNGSCTNVCPVKINIHEQIYTWRKVIAERHQLPMVKREAMRVAGKILASPRLYRAAVEAAAAGIERLPRFMIYNPFNAWGRQREVPAAPSTTFRQWFVKNRGERAPSSAEEPR